MLGCNQEKNIDQQLQGYIPATVERVIDGDTFHAVLEDGSIIKTRMIGIDTPESTNKIDLYGKEASDYTKDRLKKGTKVWLELDVEEKDRYGRSLAYIWLEQPTENSEAEVKTKMYNADLLLNGYAQVMTVPPNVKYADLFIGLQQEARENNKGLWGLTGKEECRENYYVASSKGNKFHRPNCKWAKEITPDNLIKFATKDQAITAGYEPCRTCNP